MARVSSPPEIGLVLYPGVQRASVDGLTDLLTVADRNARQRLNQTAPLLRISHLAYDEAQDRIVRVFDSLPAEDGAPTILVLLPSLEKPAEPPQAGGLVDYLKSRHQEGTVLASVCAGTFLLAATGVLAGRVATTHWSYAEALAERFTDIRVDADKLIIDDGDIITAGGMMAWTDLGLTLIERLLGPATMIETARSFIIDPPGRDQRAYSVFSPRLRHGDAAILKVQHWLQRIDLPEVTVAAMAQHAGLEPRTFQRRFQRATGFAPLTYCQNLRIGRARIMLESTTLPVDQIAWQCGYKDPKSFRKVFAKIAGLSPGQYRQRFSAARQETAPRQGNAPAHAGEHR